MHATHQIHMQGSDPRCSQPISTLNAHHRYYPAHVNWMMLSTKRVERPPFYVVERGRGTALIE